MTPQGGTASSFRDIIRIERALKAVLFGFGPNYFGVSPEGLQLSHSGCW